MNVSVTYTIISALVFVLLLLEIQKRKLAKTKNVAIIVIDFILFLLTIPPYVIKTVKWDIYLKLTTKPTEIISNVLKIDVSKIDRDYTFILYAIVLLLVALLLSFISSKLKAKVTNSDVKVITVSEKLVYFEMNKNGKVTNITENFYNHFEDNRLHIGFKKIAKEVMVNDKVIKIKNLAKEISKAEFNPSLKVCVKLKNDEVVTLELYKAEKLKKNKVVGYDVCNRADQMTESAKIQVLSSSKNKLANIINLIPSSICIYDDLSGLYICNRAFCDLVELDTQEISYNAFSNLVYQDDYDKFINQVYDRKIQIQSFRLLTKNGYLWFEQKTYRVDGVDYNLICESSKGLETTVKPLTYIEMVRDIDVKFKNGVNFSIGILSFNNLLSITSGFNSDICDELVRKYFEKLSKKLNIVNLKTYRFGDIEYGILFENFEEYNLILRGLKNKSSILTDADVYLNDHRFTLKNKIGICEASQVEEKQPENMIKLALEALDICNDQSYPNDYSIYYHYKKKQDYSLKTYGISFDDEYLDNIYKVKK